MLIAGLLFFSKPLLGLENDIRGQLSWWLTYNPDQRITMTGLRYIPELSLDHYFASGHSLHAELSANIYGSYCFSYMKKTESSNDLKPYRMWLRFSSSQYEIRIGLQKINFGSAILLRPLMWFDSIDPRDPLQLTDGVYSILGRYYFLNNANIWLWVLLGNDKTRGWDVFSSDRDSPEYGGRVQIPFLGGELALTYHHRQIDFNDSSLSIPISSLKTFPEQRLGLDGKWDIGIGVWFEGSLIFRDIEYNPLKYQRMIDLGADYTFDLGNGLNISAEYFTFETSSEILGAGESASFSAASINYPFNILDNLTLMFYYDWDNENLYNFFNWQRRYDDWSFYIMGFWNPLQFQLYYNRPGENIYSGKGIQLMVVYNH